MALRPLLLAVAAVFAHCVRADEVDRLAPDFVKASILVASPGEDLFSSSGHMCLHLRCETYGLDNCFSYEHEKSHDPFVSTFFEKIKMGLFVVPLAEYLKQFAEAGRSVTEYPLDLPPDMKVRLWRILDQTAEKGANLPYDYIGRACTVTTVDFLRQASPPHRFEVKKWPAKFAKTRREICADSYGHAPWLACLLHLATGTDLDRPCSNYEKLLIPTDVVEVLALATIDGKKVLDPSAAVEVLPRTSPPPRPFPVSPMAAAIALLAVSCANAFLRRSWIDWMLLALLVPPSIFLGHLFFFSNLPMTNWNWMIVPVNLLPVVLWRWRRWWSLPYAVLLIAWELFVLLAPHQLMHPSFYVFVAAYIVLYLRETLAKAHREKTLSGIVGKQ